MTDLLHEGLAIQDMLPFDELPVDLEPGIFVLLDDREAHIQNTYHALSQLGLVSRNKAALNTPGVVPRIAAENHMDKDEFRKLMEQRTRQREQDARDAYEVSIGGVNANEDLVLMGGWVNFRTTYGGASGADARGNYKRILEKAAGQFEYELPEIK